MLSKFRKAARKVATLSRLNMSTDEETDAQRAAKERYSVSVAERALRLLGAMNTGDGADGLDDMLVQDGNTAALRRLFEAGDWGAAQSSLRAVGRLAGVWGERQPSDGDKRPRKPGKLPTEVKPGPLVSVNDPQPAVAIAPTEPGAMPVPEATAVPKANVTKRLNAMAKQGVFSAAASALASSDTTEEFASECVLMLSELTVGHGQSVQSLGLDKKSLQALQTTVRRFGANPVVSRQGSRLVAELGEVYTEQSGKVFEDYLRQAVAAFKAAKGYKRHVDASTADSASPSFYFACPDGSTTWDAPALMTAAVESVFPVDRMARFLEDDAVTLINGDIITGLVEVCVDQMHDVGVTAALASGLAKVAGNTGNHGVLVGAGTVALGVSLLNSHMQDIHTCEAVTQLLLPFSFNLDYTRVIATADAVPVLIRTMERHVTTASPKYGSPLKWEPADAEADRQVTLKESPNAARLARKEPRTVQACVQCVANLACDNEPWDGGSGESTVDRIVAADAIRVLGVIMKSHLEKPRLLEDAMCALSNIAFVSDEIRLAIGRLVTQTVVEVSVVGGGCWVLRVCT